MEFIGKKNESRMLSFTSHVQFSNYFNEMIKNRRAKVKLDIISTLMFDMDRNFIARMMNNYL